MSWTDERVAILKKLWNDGLSASQIANELGGVTRNAVIGKVHRLGLSGRGKTSSTSTRSRAKQAPRSTTAKPKTGANSSATSTPRGGVSGSAHGNAALKMQPEEAPAIAPDTRSNDDLVIPIHERATILMLTEHTCKWPYGDPTDKDFYYCGRHSEEDTPYCKHHARLAYQPKADRRRSGMSATG